MTHLSLFSGIGGIDLAAHWAGFETVAFVERDTYCQKVLAKNFPGVPIYDDVRTFEATNIGRVDLLSGGFPCQDISTASANTWARGIEGSKSGLFWQAVRIIKECQPSWIVLENVYHLKARGLDECADALAQIGYKTENLVLGAGNAGATHQRRRFFLVGNAYGNSEPVSRKYAKASGVQRVKAHQSLDEARALALRVDDGVPNRLDRSRLRALGNAVVPSQVYPLLQAIADYEGAA